MIACLATATLLLLPQAGNDEAKQIVAKWRAQLSAAQTVSAVMDGTRAQDRTLMRMAKPNLFSFVSPGYELHSDGTQTIIYTIEQKQYMKLPESFKDQFGTMAPGLSPFFSDPSPLKEDSVVMGVFKGAPSAEISYKVGGSGVLLLYIDRATSLPLASMMKFGKSSSTLTYSDVKLDEPMPAESFKWTPPAGVTEAQMGGSDDYEKNLLKVGSKAPDFTIKSPKGADLNLEKSLKGSKGMLVNFWFYG